MSTSVIPVFESAANFSSPCVLEPAIALSARSATLSAVFRINDSHASGVLFFLPGQAVFAWEEGRLYAGFCSGGEWNYHLMSGPLDTAEGEIHHAAMVIGHHLVVSQGEDWMEVKLYFDGVPVAGNRYERAPSDPASGAAEVGQGRSISGMHDAFPGEILRIQLYDQMLPEDAIQQCVLGNPHVKPAFFIPETLPDHFDVLLHDCELEPEFLSALKSLMQNRFPFRPAPARLKEMIRRHEIAALQGKETTLFLSDAPEFGGIISWYDRIAQRELLAPDHRFFVFICEYHGKKFELDPYAPETTCLLLSKPEFCEGHWNFTIRCSFCRKGLPEGGLEALVYCAFENDRLEYEVEIRNTTDGLILRHCTFPAAKISTFPGGGDAMLVPAMCGVEYQDAAARNAGYTSWYPRGNASLQAGAYYDQNGRGICCFIEDRLARAKEFEFHAGASGCELNFVWTVARNTDGSPNSFKPVCRASFTLIRDGWYETGMNYRKMLHNVNALWWNEHRTEIDNVRWLWENTLWLRIDLSHHELASIAPDLKKLASYLELPFALHIYDWEERSSHLSPMVRPTPHMMEDVADLRQHGIRSVPYTTARIWQTPDLRGEDCNYTKVALPAAVIEEDGKPAMEYYGLPCCVLCPATSVYQHWEYEMTVSLAAMGFDGIYADQIGAARPRLCWNPRHGHKIADDTAWFINGQYPLYRKIRDHWRQTAPEMILTTEDNAEHCVDLFHGLLNWRWMNDGQVPLFTEVYAGKTQFVGLDGVGEEEEAAFAKAATQLTNGEQLGWFQHRKITAPEKKIFRQFIKQLMNLRLGILVYFNHGIMAHPPRFVPKQNKRSLLWGRQGSFRVSSAPVLASSWTWNGSTATILVNWTAEEQMVGVCPAETMPGNSLLVFSDRGETWQSVADDNILRLTLSPRSGMIVLNTVDNAEPVRAAFEKIRRIPADHDPFEVKAECFPAKAVSGRPGEWMSFRDRIDVNAGDGIIYFGEFDFSPGYWVVEAEFSAPVEHPVGQAELRADSYDEKNILAVFDVGGGFGSQRRYEDIPVERFSCNLPDDFTGRHKLFFTLGRVSHCEFNRWRFKQS